MTNSKLVKHSDGTFSNCYGALAADFLYDSYGTYKGQRQLNVIDDKGPDFFFFYPKGNEAGEFSLSETDMEKATHSDKPNPLIGYLKD